MFPGSQPLLFVSFKAKNALIVRAFHGSISHQFIHCFYRVIAIKFVVFFDNAKVILFSEICKSFFHFFALFCRLHTILCKSLILLSTAFHNSRPPTATSLSIPPRCAPPSLSATHSLLVPFLLACSFFAGLFFFYTLACPFFLHGDIDDIDNLPHKNGNSVQ